MFNQILTHLIVVGKNPATGDFSVGLCHNTTVQKEHTLQGPTTKNPDEQARQWAKYYINVPLEWYSVIKQGFFAQDDKLHLVYTAVVPVNVKLNHNFNWFPISKLDEWMSDLMNEHDQQAILIGIKL